jgi:hypothetical protein
MVEMPLNELHGAERHSLETDQVLEALGTELPFYILRLRLAVRLHDPPSKGSYSAIDCYIIS